MHPAFLNRYFDIGAWHRDLFMALLEFRGEWTWQELSDTFMRVCSHLKSPPGSASQRPDWINYLRRLEYCRIECPNGETDASKITIHAYSPALPRRKPRCPRALLKAVRWSAELREKEEYWEKLLKSAQDKAYSYMEQENRDPKTSLQLLNEVDKIRNRRDKSLAAFRKKFRLAGEERNGSWPCNL